MKRGWNAFLCMVLVGILLVNLTGCSDDQAGDLITGMTAQAKDLMADVTAAAVEGIEPDEAFVSGQMKFAVELLQQSMSGTPGANVLVSPTSVMLALAMTANGAGGQTLQEMEQVLGDGMSIADLNEYLYRYAQMLTSSQEAKFSIANSIWIRNDERLEVQQGFLQNNANYYGADAYRAAFDNSTVNDINNWVKENTKERIEKIVNEINDDTMMYLINALTFDGEWVDEYMEHQVSNRTFTTESGEEKKVEMMYSDEHYYLVDDSVIGVRKPYKGGEYSFVALLPMDGDVNKYVRELTADALIQLLANETRDTVETGIPKFEVEYDITLNNALQQMGMPTAFGHGSAEPDFKNMATYAGESLYISSVVHKTYISVHERGTEAGAATSVAMDTMSALPPQEIKRVILDRPFVYMIVHNETGLPVFLGTVLDIGE